MSTLFQYSAKHCALSFTCEVDLRIWQRFCGMLPVTFVHTYVNKQIVIFEALKRPNTEKRIIQHQLGTMYIPLQRNCVEKLPHGYSSLHNDVPEAVPQGYTPTHHLPLDHHALQWYHSGTGENFFLHIVQCHYVDFIFMSLVFGLCIVIWNLTRLVFYSLFD